MSDFEVNPVGTKKQLEGLCPHGRMTTAYCEPCGLDASIYVPNSKQVFEEAIGNQYDPPPVNWDEDDRLQTPPSSRQVGGDHYKSMKIQPHYFCHVNKLGALESNIVKYACRHHQKGGRADVEKIIHYAQLLLEWEYATED